MKKITIEKLIKPLWLHLFDVFVIEGYKNSYWITRDGIEKYKGNYEETVPTLEELSKNVSKITVSDSLVKEQVLSLECSLEESPYELPTVKLYKVPRGYLGLPCENSVSIELDTFYDNLSLTLSKEEALTLAEHLKNAVSG